MIDEINRHDDCFCDCFLFWWDCSLNSGLHACKAGTLPLDAALQSILLWIFWRWGFVNYLLRLDSEQDTPDVGNQVARITGRTHQVNDFFISTSAKNFS
jgi:hypothetical protein